MYICSLFYCIFFKDNLNYISFHWQDDEPQEDAKELQQGRPYHWRDWSVIRGRDCLYIWSDAAALELSNGSNGWFRFILDGKLATMYSSGSPEGGSDSSGQLAFLWLLIGRHSRPLVGHVLEAWTLSRSACSLCCGLYSLHKLVRAQF